MTFTQESKGIHSVTYWLESVIYSKQILAWRQNLRKPRELQCCGNVAKKMQAAYSNGRSDGQMSTADKIMSRNIIYDNQHVKPVVIFLDLQV